MRTTIVIAAIGAAWILFSPIFQQPRNVVKNVNPKRVKAWESRRRKLEADVRGLEDPKRLNGALASVERYAETKDRDHLTLDLLARMHLKKGNKNKARELYREILHADPSRHQSTLQKQPDVLIRYAELCREGGDVAEAEWALAKVEGNMSEKYASAGAYAASAGYEDEAERLLGKAISIQPENKQARGMLQRLREMKANRVNEFRR